METEGCLDGRRRGSGYYRNQAEEGGQVVTNGNGNMLTRFGNPYIICVSQGISVEYSKQKLSIWGKWEERKQVTNTENSF